MVIVSDLIKGSTASEIQTSLADWRSLLNGLRFEWDMVISAAVILIVICILHRMHLQIAGMWSILGAMGIILPCILPIMLHSLETRNRYWFDILSVGYWAFFFSYALRFPVLLAARLGAGIALKDAQMVHFDHAIGISIPGMVAWGSRHWLGQIANRSYVHLQALMGCAAILPALLNRSRYSQRFVRACLILFLLGLPLFALVPAVGPWYGYHTGGDSLQALWQKDLLLVRIPTTTQVDDVAGITSFPSFHVGWAILSAQALWRSRVLRYPALVMAGLIILSTLTAGEHYALDVIGGAVVAIVSGWLADKWQHVRFNRLSLRSKTPIMHIDGRDSIFPNTCILP